MRLLPVPLLLLVACSSDTVTIVAPPEHSRVIGSYVAHMDDPRVTVVGPDDPARGLVITLSDDLPEEERWSVSGDGYDVQVHGGGVLGVQYGLTDALEGIGYRFLHPYDTVRPSSIVPADFDIDVTPDMERRGLHLHTLHPIEGLAATWMPSEQSVDESARIADWVVKNRGNHLQWPGLDDITDDDSTFAEWDAHTATIVDDMHARGLTVGVGVQLFGSANLQEAYDLIDDPGTLDDNRAAVDERIERIASIPWDVISLSFGEFFSEEPESFIANTNLVVDAVKDDLPDAQITAVIHVGNKEDQRVSYQDQELQYYFLVQFADPSIVPWIHTVMFYDLFEPADGAYLHEEFDEHRAFLLDHLKNEQPVGYFPESAYWVAFDNSVPQYLPLYVKTRGYDLQQIDAMVAEQGGARLQDHVLFSTGWEWGYWLNDRATLRMCAQRSGEDAWKDVITEAYAAVPGGSNAAAAVIDLAELQHAYLMERKLARWLSGRDAVIDFGDGLDIVSQPDRPMLDEIYEMDPADRVAVAADMARLAEYADAIAAIAPPPGTDPYVLEIQDGLHIDRLRASFVVANTLAVVTAADGGDPTARFADADAALQGAERIVAQRAERFHDPNGARWNAESWDNPTTYDYGYLRHANQLCFWRRELAQAHNVALGTDEDIPQCAL